MVDADHCIPPGGLPSVLKEVNFLKRVDLRGGVLSVKHLVQCFALATAFGPVDIGAGALVWLVLLS